MLKTNHIFVKLHALSKFTTTFQRTFNPDIAIRRFIFSKLIKQWVKIKWITIHGKPGRMPNFVEHEHTLEEMMEKHALLELWQENVRLKKTAYLMVENW